MGNADTTPEPDPPSVQDILDYPWVRCRMAAERGVGRLDMAGLEALASAEVIIEERREQARQRAADAQAEVARARPGRMRFSASGEIDTARLRRPPRGS
jgi:hypothetical protein